MSKILIHRLVLIFLCLLPNYLDINCMRIQLSI
jgi:hypothetical protein